MGKTVQSPTISYLRATVTAVSLCGAGAAWAGGQGDVGSVQQVLNLDVCPLLGMTACPQLPTLTQLVLEYSALANIPPDTVRSLNTVNICNVGGTGGLPRCDAVALNAFNLSASSSVTLSDLTPLAFVTKKGQAVATQPSDPSATSFFYAVATATSQQPDTLTLFYDYPPLTKSSFASQVVAKISLPLQVLSKTDGSERSVLSTLQISANASGALTAVVTGDFSGNGSQQSHSPAELGLQFPLGSPLVFGASPNSAKSHAIAGVRVPLVVTGPNQPAQCGKAILSGTVDPADCGNDPAYFGVIAGGNKAGSPTGVNQISGTPTAFSTNDLGFATAVLSGAPVGTAPYAAPPCPSASGTPSGAACSSPPPQSAIPLCASFAANGGSGLQPAVATFLAIWTDGRTYVSSPLVPPLPPAPPPQCPF